VSCGFQYQEKLRAEIAIHSRGSHDPLVIVFPSISVCMNCGKLEIVKEFLIPENELRLLSKRETASA
jgi:hypothetical protein